MRVGIICAMEEEVGMLAEFIPDRTVIRMGMRDYYSGTLWGVPVVLVYSRMGKVAAAATTTNMILEFDIAEIIFIGVAGSSSQNINIGDIVIGKSLYQHDLDASPIFRKHEIPLLERTFINTDKKAAEEFLIVCSQYTKNINEHFPSEILDAFNIKIPKALIGDIASGDSFVSGRNELKKIKESLPTVMCVEMEGAAVGQVCFEYNIPLSVIRIISDTADENAHVDFQKFIGLVADRYSFEILRMYFERLSYES